MNFQISLKSVTICNMICKILKYNVDLSENTNRISKIVR